MRRLFPIVTLLAGLSLALPALAMGSGSDTAAASPEVEKAQALVDQKNYPEAIKLLQDAVAKNPKDADAWNLLGFSQRNSHDLDASLDSYTKALAIDPDHKGANEYLGELYLMLGEVAQAEARLKKLDEICWLGCEEYDSLKQAIAAHKSKTGS